MSFELQLDLFDFEDSSPSMSLPSLAELKTPQPEVIIVPEVIAAPETPIFKKKLPDRDGGHSLSTRSQTQNCRQHCCHKIVEGVGKFRQSSG